MKGKVIAVIHQPVQAVDGASSLFLGPTKKCTNSIKHNIITAYSNLINKFAHFYPTDNLPHIENSTEKCVLVYNESQMDI